MMPTADNVLSVFESATFEQTLSGLFWYEEAFSFCRATADVLGFSPETVAGVIAAGSPMTGWGLNKRNAFRWLSQGFADKYLSHGIAKANAIINGADPLEILISDKVRNFYLCILTAGNHNEAVCVDRHAWSIAIGERQEFASSKGRYNAAAEAYREAARKVKIAPAKVQAVTWVAWRNRYWNNGAFDN